MGTVTAFGDLASFFLDVSQGKIPGNTGVRLIMRNPSLGTAFEDVWGPGGTQVKPTATETLEAVSDSAEDDTGGSGAISISVISLNDEYQEQDALSVNLDGVTPVTLPGGHFRVLLTSVSSSGSTNSNVGTITVRVSGGGATRSQIQPTIGVSQDGQFTMPANRTGYLVQTVPFYPKGESGTIKGIINDPEIDTEITGLVCPFYQDNISLDVMLPGTIPEKSDLTFRANSFNEDIDMVVLSELLLVDNIIVPQIENIVFGFRGL